MEREFPNSFKISVIGCGSVGATTAYSLLLRGVPTHLTLIDVRKEQAEGLDLDLEHSIPFTPYCRIQHSGDVKDCKGSDLVVITAGKRQSPGQTRLDLIKDNKKIFADIIPKIAKAAPKAILLIVSNPVDVLTYEAIKLSKFPWQRVFGSGTILDSARFQFNISQKLNIHPRSIDAYILGEHGDTSFPVWSSASILGKPLFKFDHFDKKTGEQCYINTKNAAYRIINDLGYTCYSIATAVTEIAKNIKEDSHQVFPLSVLLQKYYGHSDVCLSMPAALCRKGISELVAMPLDKTEQKKLSKSVSVLKSYQK